MRCRFGCRRPAFERELTHGERRVGSAQLRDFPQGVVEFRELTASAELCDCRELLVRGATRPDEIRMVGIREAVCACTCRAHHCLLFQRQHDAARARGGESGTDLLRALCVCDRMTPPVEDVQVGPLAASDFGKKSRTVEVRSPNLEMRSARTANGSSTEK